MNPRKSLPAKCLLPQTFLPVLFFSYLFLSTPITPLGEAATLANIAYQVAASSESVDNNLQSDTICKSDVDCDDDNNNTRDFCSPYGLQCLHVVNDSCVDFDTQCPSGCESVDIDCFPNMTERHLPIKEYTDYETIIYIDPDTGTAENDGLTPETALPTWAGISFSADTAYVQKRGTVDEITAHLNTITEDNVLLGAYGSGELPVIRKTVQTKGRFFHISANYVTVRDFSIITEGSSTLASIYSTNIPLKYATIFNVHGQSTGHYTRFENGFSLGEAQGGGHRILYSSVDGVGNDGFYSKATYYVEIGHTTIKNVNLRYFDGQDGGFELTPAQVHEDCVYTDQCYAAGDGLQFTNPVYGLHVHHNVIDKSTPNKHTIMLKGSYNDQVLIEDNYFITSKYAAGINAEARSGATNFRLVVRNNLFEYVRTAENEFSASNAAEAVAVFTHVPYLEVYNNIILGYKNGIKTSTGLTPVVDAKVYNNFFLDIGEYALHLTGLSSADIRNNYFSLDGGSLTYDTFPPNGISSHNIFSDAAFVDDNESESSMVADILLDETFRLKAGSPGFRSGSWSPFSSLTWIPQTATSFYDPAGKSYPGDGQLNIGPFQ